MLATPPDSEPHTDDPPLAEASLLLAEYLDSARAEAAFARLVERAGGMVYGSALRRTGDAQLAEEVMQNVFTILARKAASLRRHPSLAAWIFQTTRYEAAKAMRAENRRRKKLNALAEDLARDSGPRPESGEDENWREALPALYESLDTLPERERALVLERFFEGRKFNEIAEKSGRSEAACKMGVKRALDKLSRFLTSRGVTLSATAVASALTAEFARSAPLHAAALVAPKALAASGGLTAAVLFTNTVQTMSTLKTATLTGVAVLAVATVPFFMQESHATKARESLSELDGRRAALEQRVRVALDGKSAAGPVIAGEGLERTIGDLLAAAEEPLDIETLMNRLLEAVMSRDMVGMIRIFLPVANLDADQYGRLIDELKNYGGNAQVKQMAMQMLGSFAPSDNPRDSLERMMDLELEPYAYSNLLSQWAAKDPDAAYAWYQEKLAAGALAGKGVHNTPEDVLLRQLLGGMARKDPGRALDLVEQAKDASKRGNMLAEMGFGMGEQLKETGDDTHFRRLLALADAHYDRVQVVESALHAQVRDGSIADGMAFIEKYLDEPEQRRAAMVDMMANQRALPLAERAEWLLANVPPESQGEALGEFARRMMWNGQADMSQWLETQAEGPVRDAGYTSFATALEQQGSFKEAFDAAGRISDAAAREENEHRIANTWLARDPEQARERIPTAILESMQAAE
jgi:RNA polymerase sigma factor (sigma-70 family)